uniref:Uncharacterized protein n=1 Tax=Anas zonorhyncha TaxID=75864 RepID=A0A8B9U0K3_9AVES
HISTPGTTTAVSQAYNPTRQHLLAQVDEHREGGPSIIQLLTSAGSFRNSRSSNRTPCFYNTKDNEQTFIVYYTCGV